MRTDVQFGEEKMALEAVVEPRLAHDEVEEHQEAYGVIRPRKNPFDDDGPGIGHDPTMLFEKTHQMVLPETVLKDLQSQVEGLGKAGEDAIEISLLKDLVEMPDSSLVDKA